MTDAPSRSRSIFRMDLRSKTRARANLQNQLFGNQHPLLNPVILDEFFKYCPRTMWKTYRLVCRTWNNVLLPRWRKETYINFADEESCHIFNANRSCYIIIEKFLTTFEPVTSPMDKFQLVKYPFRRLRIMMTLDLPLDPMSPTPQILFWKNCGHWLRQLILKKVTIRDIPTLSNVIFRWTPNLEELCYWICPLDLGDENSPEAIAAKLTPVPPTEYVTPDVIQNNFKSLILLLELYEDQNNLELRQNGRYRFPISWVTIFSSFPNLEYIRLMGFPPETVTADLSQIFNAIDVIGKATKRPLNLKKFFAEYIGCHCPRTTCLLPVETIETFCQLPITLNSIGMDLRNGVSEDGFCRLVQQHRETLQVLILYRAGTLESYSAASYHLLPKTLTAVELLGPIFDTWEFLTFLPNLKQLSVRNKVLKMSEAMRKGPITPLINMRKLQYSSGQPTEPETLEVLVKLVPNLILLYAKLDCKGFGIACNGWKQLEQVNIYKTAVCERTFIRNVVLLKGLEFIGLKPQPGYSEHSIHQGFLKLPNLKKVRVIFASDTNPAVVQRLRDYVNEAILQEETSLSSHSHHAPVVHNCNEENLEN